MGSSDVTFGHEENGGRRRNIRRVKSQQSQNSSAGVRTRRNAAKTPENRVQQ